MISTRHKGRLIGGLLAGWFLLTSLPCAFAFSEQDAVRAIIGEAGNQGYKGMLAVACAIRNRGSLKGVYGLKAAHVDKEPRWVWAMAEKAWAESKCKDITHGATHWENIKTFGTPYWAKKMEVVFEHKDHRFYKERR